IFIFAQGFSSTSPSRSSRKERVRAVDHTLKRRPTLGQETFTGQRPSRRDFWFSTSRFMQSTVRVSARSGSGEPRRRLQDGGECMRGLFLQSHSNLFEM